MGVYNNKKIGYIIKNPSRKVFHKAYELQMKEEENQIINKIRELKNQSDMTPRGIDIAVTKQYFNNIDPYNQHKNMSLYDCINFIENDDSEDILITMPSDFHNWCRRDDLIDNIELLDCKEIYKEFPIHAKIPPFSNLMYNLSTGKEISEKTYYDDVNYHTLSSHKGQVLAKLKRLGFKDGKLSSQVGMKPPLLIQAILDALGVPLSKVQPMLVVYNE